MRIISMLICSSLVCILGCSVPKTAPDVSKESEKKVKEEIPQEEVVEDIEQAPLYDQKVMEKPVIATKKRSLFPSPKSKLSAVRSRRSSEIISYPPPPPPTPPINTEEYSSHPENTFKEVSEEPLSTFSIDVDVASYSNIRRFLNDNMLPPKNAVRIEEMINYFSYDYPQPKGKHPFSINTEIKDCPWFKHHKLFHVGLQGKKIGIESLPPSNLVFLLDVSGSMNEPNKLPLLKTGLSLLINQMRSKDRVAIVVYAGNAGLVLPSTQATEKNTILDALLNLEAGGSTAGGAGIKLAYKVAKENFIKEGNNRVILATDGDFNVGVSDDSGLVRLIEEKRKEGIFLTVLGFGSGNYKDSKMELLADRGNGNYAYIDNVLEAKKVLVQEMGGTLVTIAKDVKIQIEFNPNFVKEYRLVGYENRMLANKDFNDDTKDAGELGAGHTVTALYEIVMAENRPKVDPLKYQKPRKATKEDIYNKELCTIKFRYKKPDEDKSILIEKPVNFEVTSYISNNFNFSAAVAGFGMLLRNSEYKNDLTYESVISLAKRSKGKDLNGYRSECIKLMEKAEILSEQAKIRE